jgi:uncharacterized protein YqiB (DUF1249 family)
MYTLRLAKHQPESAAGTGKHAYKVDLPLQMAECEANYYRLLKLVGNLEQDEYRFVINRGRSESLQLLRIIERSPYTTTIQLRQIAVVPITQWLQMPRLTVRMYHDAQLAEVLAWEGHKRLRPRYDYPNQGMYQSDEKLQINQFLGECLTVCLAQGRVLDEVVPDPAPKI